MNPYAFNAMLIEEDTLDKVRELLGFHNIPTHMIERTTWVLWTQTEIPTAWTLPHVMFKNRYSVVDRTGEHLLVERIEF